MTARKIRIRILLCVVLIAATFGWISEGSSAQEKKNMTVVLRLVAEGLTAPVALAESPDGTGRLFVVDQNGLIRIIAADGKLLPEPFLDVRDRMVKLNWTYDERGLLGLAFHPDYKENGRFFVYYSALLRSEAPRGWDHTAHISEFARSSADPNRADSRSERVLLQVDEPQSNHNGGTLDFGPDRFLYISLGDGGAGNDVGEGHVEDWYEANKGGNGQNVSKTLLGKILRIDVDGKKPYGIPPDNPFVGKDGLGEIFAYGLRNPYRFSFDKGGDHVLIAGDVGQNLWEEVDIIEKGGNYGWNVKEGTHCFDASHPDNPKIKKCPDADPSGNRLIDPVIEYKNVNQKGGLGMAVIGGYVYRGTELPFLVGQYVFGDWSATHVRPGGKLLVSMPQQKGMWGFQPLGAVSSKEGRLDHFLLGFGQDLDGEIYVLTSDAHGPSGNSGKVFKLVAPGAKTP